MAKAKLTATERKLLMWPPTEETWLCQAKRRGDDEEPVVCRVANSGSETKCWLCGAKKPKKPKLVWPTYVAICERIGHTPGKRWREEGDVHESGQAGGNPPRQRRTTRRGGLRRT